MFFAGRCGANAVGLSITCNAGQAVLCCAGTVAVLIISLVACLVFMTAFFIVRVVRSNCVPATDRMVGLLK